MKNKYSHFQQMEKLRTSTDIFVLLALGYMLFVRQHVTANPLKTTLDICIIVLFAVSIVEKSISLYQKYREKRG
ncbi:hypothetical protein [Bacillus subtilis]|uniref:hypothetical protein n=1 Tax=Bacillus subtilis TaxID=1423 RepID=UPI002DBF13BF|nr:hypothetical protein [Bacillus subtilis]MEC0451485.1 hypothetical protein [Bacillus subtilis]MEC0453276.1 hypothetical protein [Bacillus subtilis]